MDRHGALPLRGSTTTRAGREGTQQRLAPWRLDLLHRGFTSWSNDHRRQQLRAGFRAWQTGQISRDAAPQSSHHYVQGHDGSATAQPTVQSSKTIASRLRQLTGQDRDDRNDRLSGRTTLQILQVASVEKRTPAPFQFTIVMRPIRTAEAIDRVFTHGFSHPHGFRHYVSQELSKIRTVINNIKNQEHSVFYLLHLDQVLLDSTDVDCNLPANLFRFPDFYWKVTCHQVLDENDKGEICEALEEALNVAAESRGGPLQKDYEVMNILWESRPGRYKAT